MSSKWWLSSSLLVAVVWGNGTGGLVCLCVGTWVLVTFPRLGRLLQGGSWFDTGPTYTHLVHPLHLPLLYINIYTRGLALNCGHYLGSQ